MFWQQHNFTSSAQNQIFDAGQFSCGQLGDATAGEEMKDNETVSGDGKIGRWQNMDQHSREELARANFFAPRTPTQTERQIERLPADCILSGTQRDPHPEEKQDQRTVLSA